MTGNTRNIFSLLLAPQNRVILVGLVFLATLVTGVAAYILSGKGDESPRGSASVNVGHVDVSESAVATGRESKQYLKEVKIFNEEVLAEKRKENPSAHPLPVFNELSPQSCQVNHDAWVDCLRATGVLGQGECASTDTQCMIDNGFIEENDCAPGDMACRKLKGLVAGKYCDPLNYNCVAERARMVGCDVDDTLCQREKGVIAPGACAPGDSACDGSRFGFCDINDEACIEKRARAAGCALSDTQCLRDNGVIAATACAPNDRNCKAKKGISFCAPDDVACIIKKARQAGCELDDTDCLRAAGVIAPGACAPGDTGCKDIPNSDKLRALIEKCAQGNCSQEEFSKMEAGIAQALIDAEGLEISDELQALIAKCARGECSPEELSKMEAGIAQALIDAEGLEISDELQALIAKCARGECSPEELARMKAGIAAARAAKMLADKGIPISGKLRALVEKCGRGECSPQELSKMEAGIAQALIDAEGLEISDELQALIAKCARGECSPEELARIKAGIAAARAAKMLVDKGRGAVCAPDDVACITDQASRVGCTLSETECLRKNGIIGQDECAPGDRTCHAAKAASSKGLRGGSSRDDRYARAARTSTSQSSTRTAAMYGNKIDDPEYMDQLLSFVSNSAVSRKPLGISFGVEKDEEKGGKQASIVKSGSQSDSSQAGTAPKANKGALLARAGSVLYGVSDLALSTDFGGPVSLTLIEPGPLHMAQLLGEMVTLDKKVRLELKRLVMKDGREFRIDAVALDSATTYAAIASRVDHHYMYRYGWWGLGTVMSAIGKAAALRAQETTIIPDGGVAQSTDLDASGEVKVAVGELGSELGETMKENMERPITVEVEPNEEMGVFFLESVFEGAAI